MWFVFTQPSVIDSISSITSPPDFITGVQQACDSDSSELYPYTRNKNQWLETKNETLEDDMSFSNV